MALAHAVWLVVLCLALVSVPLTRADFSHMGRSVCTGEHAWNV